MRGPLYNATLADLDRGERIEVVCPNCGRTSTLLVTYLIEMRQMPWDTRILDLGHKLRCKFCHFKVVTKEFIRVVHK